MDILSIKPIRDLSYRTCMIARECVWDNLKVIMILGIVFEHTLIVYDYPHWLELIWALFISWLMPLFTLISGYWFKQRSVKQLLEKYLYPMLLFSAINFFIGYFFYPNYHKGLHLIGYAMWYLWALFVFALITPKLIKKYRIKNLLVINLILIVIYNFIPICAEIQTCLNAVQFNRIIGFYPFFLLGILLNKHTLSVRYLPFYSIGTIIYMLMAILFDRFAYSSGFYIMPTFSIKQVFYLLTSYIFIGAICLFLINITSKKELYITKFGSRSMNVYLLHMLVVFPLSWGVFSHCSYSIPLIFANAILSPFLCIYFLSDKVNHIMNKLLFNRNWSVVLLFYLMSLVLVNKSWLIPNL